MSEIAAPKQREEYFVAYIIQTLTFKLHGGVEPEIRFGRFSRPSRTRYCWREDSWGANSEIGRLAGFLLLAPIAQPALLCRKEVHT